MLETDAEEEGTKTKRLWTAEDAHYVVIFTVTDLTHCMPVTRTVTPRLNDFFSFDLQSRKHKYKIFEQRKKDNVEAARRQKEEVRAKIKCVQQQSHRYIRLN